MTLVLRWRAPERPIATRWRGPEGMAEAVTRDPALPIAAIVGPPGPPGPQPLAPMVLATAFAAKYFSDEVTAIHTSGYSVTGKGAGLYVSDALATAGLAAAHPRFCKQSLDGRYWRLLADDGLNLRQAGAIGDGVVNDTAACQAAMAFAEAFSRSLHVPSGSYLVSAPLVITSPIKIFGDGDTSVILVATSLGAAVDVFSITPAAFTTNIIMRDLAIRPVSGTPGRHAIGLNITTNPIAYSEFTNITTGTFGDYAIATIPNATPLIDGFFTSVIQRCSIQGGIKLDKAGDSLRILNNTITGPRTGVLVDLVGNGSDTAHGLLIAGNNITSNGGALRVISANAGVFENNNVELPTPSGVANAAVIDIDGAAGLAVSGFVVRDNFLGSGGTAGYDTIRVNRARNTLVTGNTVGHVLGSFSYKTTANAVNTRYIENCDLLDEAVSSILSDAGANTTFIRSFGTDRQQTNNIHMLEGSAAIKWNDSAGTAIRGMYLDHIDNYFYIGPSDATATSAGMLFMANGAPVGRWTPGGNFHPQTNGAQSCGVVGSRWNEVHTSSVVFGDATVQTTAAQPLDPQLTDLAGLSYAGNALKVVRVNAAATGWELVSPSGGGGGGLSDADYGDVTVSGTGTVMTIDAGAVTLAKMAECCHRDRVLPQDRSNRRSRGANSCHAQDRSWPDRD